MLKICICERANQMSNIIPNEWTQNIAFAITMNDNQ